MTETKEQPTAIPRRATFNASASTLAAVLLSATGFAAGCASLADVTSDESMLQTTVDIDSSPSRIVVRTSDGRLFTTPRRLILPSDEEVTLVATQEGYFPAEVTLTPRLNGVLWWNLLNGGLGCLLDFSSGAAWKLRPAEVHLELEPAPRPAPPLDGGAGASAEWSAEAEENSNSEDAAEATPPAEGRITLGWDPPQQRENGEPATDVAGYRLHYGREPQKYDQVIDVGNTTTYTLAGVEPGRYYFAVTAYDSSGNESGLSQSFEAEVEAAKVASPETAEGDAER